MIFYLENPNCSPKFVKINKISKFGKSTGHKVSKNPVLILCANNKLSKKEIKKNFPFTIASQE